jgi:uncharacterized membrane-anchored protein
MKNRLIIGLFCCIALIQLITPLSMIIKRESVLRNGEQFKFKTAPVDPYDAFRGRYVALRIEGDKVPVPQGMGLSHGQSVYALISTNEEGFAKFATLATNKPAGTPFIQAKVRYVLKDKVQLDLPIDRYYMEEKSAPAAERVYREYSRRDKQDAYVLVRVKDGFAVIEALYVGGKRIEEAVKNVRNK